jgi:uncharacterized protein (TIGR02452 family)
MTETNTLAGQNRKQRQKWAEETLRMLQQTHRLHNGNVLSTKTNNQSYLLTPKSESILRVKKTTGRPPQVSMGTQSTTEAVRRLAHKKPCALNFASATKPGGGFRRGATGQEEDLCLASSLGAALEEARDFYQLNSLCPSAVYLDMALLCTDVLFLRNEEMRPLEQPIHASIISCPAPNRHAIQQEEPTSLCLVEGALTRRAQLILNAAKLSGCQCLILGAWGCGIFGNDPHQVAAVFKEAITTHAQTIPHIHFAIPDKPKTTTWEIFSTTLSPLIEYKHHTP